LIKNNKLFIGITLGLAVIVMILTACTNYPQVNWKMSVGGKVSQAGEISYSDLVKMPQTELKDILMEKTTSEDTIDSWSGPLFTEIMSKVGANPDFSSILVKADDGYEAVLIKSELEGAIVALKKDGEWIAEVDKAHGPIRIVCPKTPANKWVYSIIEIQFNP